MQRTIREIGRRLRAPLNRRHAMARLREFHRARRPLDEIIDWAMNFGTKGKFRVKTTQIPSEIRALAAEVKELNPNIILEIGMYEGGTALIWAQLAAKRVISCDIAPPGPRGDLIRAFPPPGSECRVTLLTGNSHSPDFVKRVERELGGEKVDFLFIDGDHREAGVARDFENYRPLVREGGIIAFHDIADRQIEPGNEVQFFWKKIKDRYTHREYIDQPGQTGFGIGVLET